MAVFPIIKRTSYYGIGFDYISYCHGNKISNEEIGFILQGVSDILDNGWCVEDIYTEFNNLIEIDKYRFKNFIEVKAFFNNTPPPKRNLLKNNHYRCHKELQLHSEVPIIKLEDSTVFEIESIKTYEYSLEPIGSYSLEDVIEYVMKSKKHILLENNPPKKMNGAIKHLITERYGCNDEDALNIFLFSFDEAIHYCKNHDKKLKDMFEINNFLEEAIAHNNNIKNRIKYGDITFKPKQRMLFDRSGFMDQ